MADWRRKTDTPRSWLICFVAFVTLTFNNGTYYSFGLLMPYLMEQFRQNNTTTGRQTIYLWSFEVLELPLFGG